MLSAARHIIVSLLFAICLLALSLSNGLFAIAPVSAQTQNPNLTPTTNADVPQNMHTWTQTVLLEVLSAASCQLSGVDPINPNQACLGVDTQTGKIGYVKQKPGELGGAIGVTTYAMGKLFTPPLHTSDYLNYLGSNFGVAKKAYAQGAGLKGLSPLVPLWTVFRNIVYMGFVVVFVIIGLAIMLRVKIDPRTVMNIENQIPKIIIGLVMVTLSFAISGLLIDLMYGSMYLTYNVVASSGLSKNLSSFNPSQLQGKTPLDAVGGLGGVFKPGEGADKDDKPFIGSSTGIVDLTSRVAQAGKTIIQNSLGITPAIKLIDNPLPSFLKVSLNPPEIGFELPGISPDAKLADTVIDVASIIWTRTTAHTQIDFIVNKLDFIPGAKAAAALPLAILMYPAVYSQAQFVLREVLPFGIIWLIVMVALLWALLRLAFELLKAYIGILIDTVLAPFWIIAGLFPNSPVGFGAWLKSIISNLSVFPVTLGMFLLGRVFIDVFNDKNGEMFVAPLIGNPTGGGISPLSPLIGIGIILMTPQVVTMMKELLKSPQLKYTSGIGQAVGVGTQAVNIPEHAKQIGMFQYYSGHIKELPVVSKFFGKRGTTVPKAEE